MSVPITDKNNIKDKGKRIVGNIIFKRSMLTVFLVLLQFDLMIYVSYSLSQGHRRIAEILYLLSVILVIIIINTNTKEEFKMAWIIPMCVIPVFGVMMFLFVKLNPGSIRLRHTIKKRGRDIIPFMNENKERTDWIARNDEQVGSLVHYLFYTSGFPVYTGTEVSYFPIGEAFFDDIKKTLKKAKHFIFMEYFIVNEGEMWDSVLEILKEKVKEGVEVRFMYDGTCSVMTLPYRYDKTLCEYGIKAKQFSPIVPFISTHQNNRDHRKILVIDGQIAYTGGLNLADEYINKKERFGHWKDTAVRLDGPGVQGFTAMFLHLWNVTEHNPGDLARYIDVPVDSTTAEGYVIPYGDDALNDEDIAENVYMDILNKAHRYVYIMTPYFIVDSEMLSCITFAAKRGIDVRMILPHIPDKKIPFAIARTYYKTLLKAGVKIFEYEPGFVHAKQFVSDDMKACVGSINLDYRSLYHHFECGVFIYNNPVIGDIKKDFLATQKKCICVDENYCDSLNLFGRLIGGLFRIFAPLL